MENPWKYKNCSQNSTFTIFVSYVLSTFIFKSTSTPKYKQNYCALDRSLFSWKSKKYVVSSEKLVFYVSILNELKLLVKKILHSFSSWPEVGMKEKVIVLFGNWKLIWHFRPEPFIQICTYFKILAP